MSESKGHRPGCPTCTRQVDGPGANRWFPFCSARCKDIDLAKWLRGEFRIPGRPVAAPPDGDGRAGETSDEDV